MNELADDDWEDGGLAEIAKGGRGRGDKRPLEGGWWTAVCERGRSESLLSKSQRVEGGARERIHEAGTEPAGGDITSLLNTHRFAPHPPFFEDTPLVCPSQQFRLLRRLNPPPPRTQPSSSDG